MSVRCPDATIIGKGILQDWRLLFRQYATIEKCEGYYLPVLVWELSKSDEKSLDRYEGVPLFYFKENLEIDVESLDGRKLGKINGIVYIMTQQAVNRRTSMPSHCYFALLAEGYKKFGFDLEILTDALKECATIVKRNGDKY